MKQKIIGKASLRFTIGASLISVPLWNLCGMMKYSVGIVRVGYLNKVWDSQTSQTHGWNASVVFNLYLMTQYLVIKLLLIDCIHSTRNFCLTKNLHIPCKSPKQPNNQILHPLPKICPQRECDCIFHFFGPFLVDAWPLADKHTTGWERILIQLDTVKGSTFECRRCISGRNVEC